MYHNKRIAVIIVAAGSGKRMGGDIPKQFLQIGNEMVVEKAVGAFSNHPYIDDIYLVVRKSDMAFCKDQLINKKRLSKVRAILAGGKERQDSVFNALCAMEEQIKPAFDYVLVHDGARPFVSANAISRLIEGAVTYDAAALGVPVKDTIKRVGGQWLLETLDRTTLISMQTPQGFRFDLLLEAYKKAREDCYIGTDDSALVERLGKKVYLVKGEYSNIKITTKEDLGYIRRQSDNVEQKPKQRDFKTGIGFDAHAFSKDRKLVLGGVSIAHSSGLLGHSDADVLTHGIMDALLGACGLGDIGLHFPDSEDRFKGVSSLELLGYVKGLISTAGYNISNIDAVLIGEEPKIAPYVKEIKANIADVLQIDQTRINIKGTTTEKMGFCGRKEGLAVMATATVYKE
ncbi:MAG: 2-C-methyl-D-erythritol 4-phosphate cytidylyltransferase [Clostridiales bacterium]|jgi:2-C-methyl-D-erythritol 4-phosphate cytidylyltransferase/2-C-methyl-D-erythritol 2,4-cyclodiphosphate synthase|nr:2-C-methyl-D-erythritol 4-phosphate cytidylyltransferase [Clostridiales bacterium]